MKYRYHNPTPPPIPWVTEAFFDFWSTRVHPLWTLRRPLAQLVSRRAEGSAAVTVVLKPNAHFDGVKPGQHVSLTVQVDGRMTTRSYSPTVLADGRLEVTVKLVTGGKVSALLAGGLPIGAILGISQAFGEMTVEMPAAQPLLLLAAGSGITPMRALLRQLDASGMSAPVDLVYWARRREELCFAEELAAIAARHPSFSLHIALTRDPAAPAPRVDAFAFEALGDLGSARALVCGPGGFVDAAQARLQGRVASLQSEAFTPPVLPAAETGTVQVELRRSGRTLSLPRGTSLLQALEAEGLRPASGCRMGICNTCVCGKVSGVTRHTLTGEHAAEPATQVKLCVNSASTDLILEL